jgi:hypothetical protein
MMGILLQRGPELLDMLKNGKYLEFVAAPFEARMGLAAFALVISGTVTLGLWTWTEEFMVPAIVLALFGGVFVTVVPGQAALIGVGIVLIALSLAFWAIWRD